MMNAEVAEVRKGPVELNRISAGIIQAAMKVHTALGPGLLESAYETCLAYELRKTGFHVTTQVPLAVTYEDAVLDIGYRLDMLVEDEVIIELKAIESIQPVHKAQLLSYLRLRKSRLGLLINFHVEHLRDGISRIVNRL